MGSDAASIRRGYGEAQAIWRSVGGGDTDCALRAAGDGRRAVPVTTIVLRPVEAAGQPTPQVTPTVLRLKKIVFPVSIYEAEQRGQSFGQIATAFIRVVDRDEGREIARHDLTGDASAETAMVFGELYRHSGRWKFGAVGQGYASGLRGIAQDFGVNIGQPDAPSATEQRARRQAPPAPTRSGTGRPTRHPQPQLHSPPQPQSPHIDQVCEETPMTCFFDPSHGPGTAGAVWSPQWGVPRQIQACPACAQRVQTTPSPYYTPPQATPQPDTSRPGIRSSPTGASPTPAIRSSRSAVGTASARSSAPARPDWSVAPCSTKRSATTSPTSPS